MGITITTTVHPRNEVIATCGACGAEIGRLTYNGYADHGRQKARLKKIPSCKNCGVAFVDRPAFIKWEHTAAGDYIAKAKNGDFLVWKWGAGYRWRYRSYGAQSPEGIFYARTKDGAKKACQKHKEWQV